MSRMSGGKKLLLLGILIVVLLVGLHYSAGDLYELPPLAAATRDVLAPVQRLVMAVGREVGEFVSYPVRLVNVSKQNRELEDKVDRLEGELVKLREIRDENARLKKIMDFQGVVAPQMSTVAAAVIARDTGNWFGSIIINRGENDGLRRDMAVITPAGLVGRTTRVSANTAEVLLITDPRSGVGCLIQEKRAPGIVEGVAGGRGSLQMVNIPGDLAPEIGYTVVTSGLGSIYPKGLPVGTVLETHKDKAGLFRMAMLRPYVDFNRLEEVLVITAVHPTGS